MKNVIFENPLLEAIKSGQVDTVKAMLEDNTDLLAYRERVSKYDHLKGGGTGDNPLMVAVCFKQFEIVELLLSKGADPAMEGYIPGTTTTSLPLDLAIVNYCELSSKIIEVLMKYKVVFTQEIVDHEFLALISNREQCKFKIAKYKQLTRIGISDEVLNTSTEKELSGYVDADPEIFCGELYNEALDPLCRTIDSGYKELFLLELERCNDIERKNIPALIYNCFLTGHINKDFVRGATPLLVAIIKHDDPERETLWFLRQLVLHGSNINAIDDEKNNAFHWTIKTLLARDYNARQFYETKALWSSIVEIFHYLLTEAECYTSPNNAGESPESYLYRQAKELAKEKKFDTKLKCVIKLIEMAEKSGVSSRNFRVHL